MKTTTSQNRISASQPGSESFRHPESHGLRFDNFARTLQMNLATSQHGRIALHLLVALKTGHYLWHWQGIVRELARA